MGNTEFENDYYDYDYCEECHLYGDDYYYDEEIGEYISRCYECKHILFSHRFYDEEED